MAAFRFKTIGCGPCLGSGYRIYTVAGRREVVVCDICGGSGVKRESPITPDLTAMLLDDNEMAS